MKSAAGTFRKTGSAARKRRWFQIHKKSAINPASISGAAAEL